MKMSKIAVLLLSVIIFLCLGVFAQTQSVRTEYAFVSWKKTCDSSVANYAVYFTSNTLSSPQPQVVLEEPDDCGTYYPKRTNYYYGSYNISNIIIVDVTNTNCIISNLTANVKYYFMVTCRSGSLEGQQSEEVSLIPQLIIRTSTFPKVARTFIKTIK